MNSSEHQIIVTFLNGITPSYEHGGFVDTIRGWFFDYSIEHVDEYGSFMAMMILDARSPSGFTFEVVGQGVLRVIGGKVYRTHNTVIRDKKLLCREQVKSLEHFERLLLRIEYYRQLSTKRTQADEEWERLDDERLAMRAA